MALLPGGFASTPPPVLSGLVPDPSNPSHAPSPTKADPAHNVGRGQASYFGSEAREQGWGPWRGAASPLSTS